MYEVSEYILFYLMLEGIGVKEELHSIGVTDESIQIEKARSKKLVELLVEVLRSLDKDLMSVDCYKRGVQDFGIKMQHSGPMFLAYTKNTNEDSVKSLYALMALKLPRILRKMGMNGRFVRGSLVKGFGWEIEEAGCRTLYGPVMNKAWQYLTSYAYSLRIIIEPKLFKILSDRSSYGDSKDADWLPLYASKDYDGQGIFDYLACDRNSPSVLYDTEEVAINEMKRTLRAIQQVVSNLVGVYYKHDNSKSVRMSMALREYVLRSISRWTNRNELDILREVDPNIDRVYRKMQNANG